MWFMSGVQKLCNKCHVSKILDLFLTYQLLFGLIWSKPDEVIKESNSSPLAFIWCFAIDLKPKQEKAGICGCLYSFQLPSPFFHDFRTFPWTVVNIWKHMTHSDHYFLNCDGRQIDTNINFGYVMNLYEMYTGEYFQIFSW